MKKTRVLIIDDHPAIRHGYAQLINATDDLTIIGEAGNRLEALEILRKTRPDIVMLDILLKDDDPSGLDLIQEILATVRRIPILVVSMFDEALYAERAIDSGAMGYLMKQEPVREILRALRAVREGGLFLSARLLEMRARARDGHSIAALTPREFEIFRFLGMGFPARDIAEKVCLSVKTVETHQLNIRKKLGFAGMGELKRFAVGWFRSGNEAPSKESKDS